MLCPRCTLHREGCFYYCDGLYLQSLNAAFNAAVGQDEKMNCDHIARCEFDGIRLRPGDQVTAYNEIRSPNCEAETVKAKIECGKDGKFINLKDGKLVGEGKYAHSYCMPRDGTCRREKSIFLCHCYRGKLYLCVTLMTDKEIQL